MASKTIAWTTGGGNITLSYGGQGNGSVSVSSSQNDSFDARSQSIYLSTTLGKPEQNIAVTITQQGKSYSPGEVFNFDYTGSVQSIVLPKGKYKLQCWGAQGGTSYGSSSAVGSKGGYSEGVLTLAKTTTLYVFVGGKGSRGSSTSLVNGGWNGGGASVGKSSYNSGGTNGYSNPACGGGATDIALVTSSMVYSNGRTNRSQESLLSRIIVAGGGAGGSYRYTTVTTTSTSWETFKTVSLSNYWLTGSSHVQFIEISNSGFEAGATYKYTVSPTTNLKSLNIQYYNGSTYVNNHIISNGGTAVFPTSTVTKVELQAVYTSQAGSCAMTISKQVSTSSSSNSSGYSNKSQQGGGISGKGQYPGSQSAAGNGGDFGLGANQAVTNYRYVSGAGGGGWYGGGRNYSDSSTGYVNYSGGGSGFVNTEANASYRPSGYTGLQLDSGTTTAGDTSHPSTSGGTETGHSGNGYAIITVIE